MRNLPMRAHAMTKTSSKKVIDSRHLAAILATVGMLAGGLLAGCAAEEPTPSAAVSTVKSHASAACDVVTIAAPLPFAEIPAGNPVTLITTLGTDGSGTLDGRTLRIYIDGVLDRDVAQHEGIVLNDVAPGQRHIAIQLVADGTPVDCAHARAEVYVRIVADCDTNADCEDGLACSNQSCVGGQCRYGLIGGLDSTCCDNDYECPHGWVGCADTHECVACLTAADCDDGDPCTTDSCGASGCTHAPIDQCCDADSDCEDGDACTTDACVGGTCSYQPGGGTDCCNTHEDCRPDDPCIPYVCYKKTVGGGDPIAYCRYGPPIGNCCVDDGDCNDGHPCTQDLCDRAPEAETGSCTFPADESLEDCCALNADCDDGDPLTEDRCVQFACQHTEDPTACQLPPTSAIVISEIQANPRVIPDHGGEYIELYNTSSEAIDLTGWRLQAGATLHVFDASNLTALGGGSLTVYPDQFFVIGNGGPECFNGGFTPDYVVPFLLPDPDNDASPSAIIRIRNASGAPIDQVRYDAGWPWIDGHAFELKHPSLDNWERTNWTAAGTHSNGQLNATYGRFELGLWGSPRNPNPSSGTGIPSARCDELAVELGGGALCEAPRCGWDGHCVVVQTNGCCQENIDCEDGDPCTKDECDLNTNSCKPPIDEWGCCEVNSDCDDGDPCTTDRCIQKTCLNVNTGGACASCDGKPRPLPVPCGVGDCETTTTVECLWGDWVHSCQPPEACVLGTIDNPGHSCKDLLDRGASQGDGYYWVDPDARGSIPASEVYCDMTRQGGGWTLAVKSRYQGGVAGVADALGTAPQGLAHHGSGYKLSDPFIRALAGQSRRFDVLADQSGYNYSASSGNFEYAVLRDYTGYWRFDGPAPPSSSPTTLTSYRLEDDALSWQGELLCGEYGGWGINCYDIVSGGNPRGGAGCNFPMGNGDNTGHHHFFMAAPNTDTYLYLCNGGQHSSSRDMNHRFWVREAEVTAAVTFQGANRPRSCREVKQANPGADDGLYFIDPDGLGPELTELALCDMTTDGGGWTLALRTYLGATAHPLSQGGGTPYAALRQDGGYYKLSDSGVRAAIGSKQNFDVLATQVGYDPATSSGAHEYAILRNYSAPWRSDWTTRASTTPTTMEAYRAFDDALIWSGELACGAGTSGIVCDTPVANDPQGGAGCAVPLGTATDPSWHTFAMSGATPGDGGSVLALCNGYQASTGPDLAHLFWFRERELAICPGFIDPLPNGTCPRDDHETVGTPASPGWSCKHILETGSSTGDGTYWVDPDGPGSISPVEVYCDMTTDGGGWTLGLKSQYSNGIKDRTQGIGSVVQAVASDSTPYKLADGFIRALIGPTQRFDVLATQKGFHTSYSTGAYEHIVLRDYTGTWRFDGPVAPSTSATTLTSYRTADGAVAWRGELLCGNDGAGINCYDLLRGNNPGGGSGCAVNMGKSTSGGWHTFYMSATNSDTYLYLCNGAQHSSGRDMQHRFWFREADTPVGKRFTELGQPRTCRDVLTAEPDAPDGVYPIDVDGPGPRETLLARCNMTIDGGGWTLALRSGSEGAPSMALSQGVGHLGVGGEKTFYKLHDQVLKQLIGPNQNFDILATQLGFDIASAVGAREHVIVRNYTAPWRYDWTTPASSTPTTFEAYDSATHTLVWSGDLACGEGQAGIVCGETVPEGDPQGGAGCTEALGTQTDADWHHFAMSSAADQSSRLALCNGDQQSATADLAHLFWFRERDIADCGEGIDALADGSCPGPDLGPNPIGSASTHAGWSCKHVLDQGASTGDGFYWVDPDGPGSIEATQVYCDMTRDGGGWTLGLKSYYQGGVKGVTSGRGEALDGLTRKGNAYKLSDGFIRALIGSTQRFDVLGDQSGYNNSYSTGDYEYAVLRNYTGTWRFDGPVSPSTTPTTMTSYVADDHGIAWRGELLCGQDGAGVNCYDVIGGANPAGGAGCLVNMGKSTSGSWHHFYMAATNSDTYMYLCNGAQHSSGRDMNHRFWFREMDHPIAKRFVELGQPRSCKAILDTDGSAPSGIYPVDVDGEGPLETALVLCDMETDGGGWTLGLRSSAEGRPEYGLSQDVGHLGIGTTYYKLHDEQIRGLIGPTRNFDLLATQQGFDQASSDGAHERLIVRNYTASWRFDWSTPASSTPTTFEAYDVATGSPIWTGDFGCGGGDSGIVCSEVTGGGDPAGGAGCFKALGTASDPSWNHFAMSGPGMASRLAVCNGDQSTASVGVAHLFWFRERDVIVCHEGAAPLPDGTCPGPDLGAEPLGSTATNPGWSCKHVLDSQAATGDGMYWVDPDGPGSIQPTEVYCDMTRDGGGWTLGLKSYYQGGVKGVTGARGGAADGLSRKGTPYKLADGFLRALIGTSQRFDVLGDQNGYNESYSTGAYEYAVLRNYTGTWRFDGPVAASATPTVLMSYVADDHGVAWRGELSCGQDGAGINCYDVIGGTNPAGGSGCISQLGKSTSGSWHHFFMSATNSDTYMYLCNGAQHSSGRDMNHRFWFREIEHPIAKRFIELGQPGSCKAILDADPAAGDGIYPVDVDGPGPLETTLVMCNMTVDGGGWTLGLRASAEDRPDYGLAQDVGHLSDGTTYYKLGDRIVRGLIGPTENFDLLATQEGYDANSADGADEYAVVRNYTAEWRFDWATKASRTPATFASYDAANGAEVWSGELTCGGGEAGIVCDEVAPQANPQGGDGCAEALGTASDPSWHHFAMSGPGMASRLALCNGDQHTNAVGVAQLFWFRERDTIVCHEGAAPLPDGTCPGPDHGPEALGSTSTNPGWSCKHILDERADTGDGAYWIDPDGPGSIAPTAVYCDMTRDGGGWTLGLKSYYQGGVKGVTGERGDALDGLSRKGTPYKLSDGFIRALIGRTQRFDVLGDQNGYNNSYSTGNFEYAVLRNYTGTWRFDGPVAASTTPTVLTSYAAEDGTTAWRGELLCGKDGAGINCYDVIGGTNPAGGSGCLAQMGKSTSGSWHHFYMSATNSDTYMYLCNGAQHSSGRDMNHRFWFRESDEPIAKTYIDLGQPRSCRDILDADPTRPDGLYPVDVDGPGPVQTTLVMCNMSVDGGGWTLAVRSSAENRPAFGLSQDVGHFGDGTTFYKLKDRLLRGLIGPNENFDVLATQQGYDPATANGADEYVILRNYTAAWRFDWATSPSRTPTTFEAYDAGTDSVVWSGDLVCGQGQAGISCSGVASGAEPAGGDGCSEALGTATDPEWHDFVMAGDGMTSRLALCNGDQHTGAIGVTHLFWFRERDAADCPEGVANLPDGSCPGPDLGAEPLGSTSTNAGWSCKHILDQSASTGDGTYWVDPDGPGSIQPAEVYCDMTRDGGGWTLSLKSYYQGGVKGVTGARGDAADGLALKGSPYKLSDDFVRALIGTSQRFDVLGDQNGYNESYSTGNFEYAVLRNYTGTWRFDGPVAPSTTATILTSYLSEDDTVAWRGELECGQDGAGINCYDVLSGTNPAGGSGCIVQMGKSTSGSWHHFYMSATNSDTYMYLCNGAQHSSGRDMNHRYWFREIDQPIAKAFIELGQPRTCRDILDADPTAADGVYPVDVDGAGPLATTLVNCNMTLDGGGWTLGLRASAEDAPAYGVSQAIGHIGDGTKYYKLADRVLRGVIGPTDNFDVLATQQGYAAASADGADEYVIVRNYTAALRFDWATRASSTPATFESYDADSGALVWSGELSCGGGEAGIVCDAVASGTNPEGGDGCTTALGTKGDAEWHHFTMSGVDMSSRLALCNGDQTTGGVGVVQLFWFRERDEPICAGGATPLPDGTCPGPDHGPQPLGSAATNPGWSCKHILDERASEGDGVYWVDPDGPGSITPTEVYCDMTRDGGGWTLGLKSYYKGGVKGVSGPLGDVDDALVRKGSPFKLADDFIRALIGSQQRFDVLADQNGYNNSYSTGDYEYAVLRNYTGTWRFDGPVAASSTPTVLTSYLADDGTVAWRGELGCGRPGAGINCYDVIGGTNPAGGAGCIAQMGKSTSGGWHHLYMADTNSDTYLYLCNGAQHSSGRDMNHRFWFREVGEPIAKLFADLSEPRSCKDVLVADPDATDGLYPVDVDGGGPLATTLVRCNMSIDGGGWTLGVRTVAAGLEYGLSQGAGDHDFETTGRYYKLADAEIRAVTGVNQNFDVLATQQGFDPASTNGANEYAILRNYTAAFRFDWATPASSTPTSIESYRASDGALVWNGNLLCGAGRAGIVCDDPDGSNPQGGSGCDTSLGVNHHHTWHRFGMSSDYMSSTLALCNGNQDSSVFGVSHLFWFRERDVAICEGGAQPKPDGSCPTPDPGDLGQETNPGLSCKDLLGRGASTGDGFYWVDPDAGGAIAAAEVYCDMTRDGGGWTLGVKARYNGGVAGEAGALGSPLQGMAHMGSPYKLSDDFLRALIGPTEWFDVLGDQSGYNSSYSNGNYEYIVLRNYTGTWRFDGAVDASSTPTVMTSYRAEDAAVAWQGQLLCGEGGFGINCYDILSGVNPAGGAGCLIKMGKSTSGDWHRFYMSWPGSDTYVYICNGAQHSSGQNMNHRFWFRELAAPVGAP